MRLAQHGGPKSLLDIEKGAEKPDAIVDIFLSER